MSYATKLCSARLAAPSYSCQPRSSKPPCEAPVDSIRGHISSLEVLYARGLLGAVVDAASVAIEQLVPPSAELEEQRPTIGERVAARE